MTCVQELQPDPELEATAEASEKFLKFTATKELEMDQPSCSFFREGKLGS